MKIANEELPCVEENIPIKAKQLNGTASVEEEKDKSKTPETDGTVTSTNETADSQPSVDSTTDDGDDHNLLQNGEVSTINGNESFSNESVNAMTDDNLSDISDESITLHVSDEEDEGQPKENEKPVNSTSSPSHAWDEVLSSSSPVNRSEDKTITENNTPVEMAIAEESNETLEKVESLEKKESNEQEGANDVSLSPISEEDLLEPQKNDKDSETEEKMDDEEDKDEDEEEERMEEEENDEEEEKDLDEAMEFDVGSENNEQVENEPAENEEQDNEEGEAEVEAEKESDTRPESPTTDPLNEEVDKSEEKKSPVEKNEKMEVEKTNQDDFKLSDLGTTEPEEVLQEIDRILFTDEPEEDNEKDDPDFDEADIPVDGSDSEVEDTSVGKLEKSPKGRGKRKKKRGPRRLSKCKKFKISKKNIKKWKEANMQDNPYDNEEEADANEMSENSATVDDVSDEAPVVSRSESVENLNESEKVNAEENQNCDKNIPESQEDSSNVEVKVKQEENIEDKKEETEITVTETVKLETSTSPVPEEICNNTAKEASVDSKSEDADVEDKKDTQKIDDSDIVDIRSDSEIKDEFASSTVTSKKRSLDSEEELIYAKKPKVNTDEEVLRKIEKKEYVPLDSLKDFLENKLNKLTRKNLEEFCVQKICEVIGQNSELGELRHQIKVQEQMLDSWRTKIVALSKQTRDLEIVKCRLIQDMRAKEKEGGNVADTVPVKITRSVGLQVSLQGSPRNRPPIGNQSTPQPTNNPQNDAARRRVVRQSLPAKLPNGPTNTPVQNRNVIPILPSKPNTPSKPVPQKAPPVRPAEPNKDQSILHKTLQKPTSSPATSTTPARKQPESAPKAVIDLTDEDESNKTTQAAATTTTTAPPTPTTSAAPVTVPSGVRLVASHTITNNTPITTTTSLVATSVTGPRLTYLVTNGQQPQQVMLHTFAPNATPTRPTQVRAGQFMFKQLAPNSTQNQRVNTIRLPGNSVMLDHAGRPTGQIRIGNVSNMPRAAAPRPPAPRQSQIIRHPAPLPGPPPLQPSQPTWKAMPPRPSLKISRVGDGIVLSWKILTRDLSMYEEIASYQLYAYQETNATPTTDMWRKVGDVKALALPMACTLTQFTDGNKYHFAVRAVDVKSRVGPFSQPEQITLI